MSGGEMILYTADTGHTAPGRDALTLPGMALTSESRRRVP